MFLDSQSWTRGSCQVKRKGNWYSQQDEYVNESQVGKFSLVQNQYYFVARDFVDKIKLDKKQQFKSEGEALAYYKDAVKKINQKLFMIIPRDLITAKG